MEARRVLILARSNCAVPLKIINDAEDELEMRDMRRHLQDRDSDDDEEYEETRKAFTNLPSNFLLFLKKVCAHKKRLFSSYR